MQKTLIYSLLLHHNHRALKKSSKTLSSVHQQHHCVWYLSQMECTYTTSLINKMLPYSSRMHPHRLNLGGGGRLLLRNCQSFVLPLSVWFAPFQSDIPEASTRVFSLSLWDVYLQTTTGTSDNPAEGIYCRLEASYIERVGGAMATGVAATVEGGERGGELAAAATFLNGRKGGGEGNNNNNNNNNNAGGGAAARGGRRKAQFLEVYQQLKKELLSDSDLFQYTTESRSWVEEMLDYTVPGGKLNRGTSVIDSLSLLKGGDEELSDEDVLRACALGWCIEWLQAYFLVEDDIMDNSVTRRGQPCWYRVPKVGLIAINDGIVLRTHISRILKTHFRKLPIYTQLLEIFNEVEYQTASGQMLDLITTPAGEVDLSKYVLPTYLRIVKYKTAYYSFYLPVACALLLAGEKDEDKFEAAKEILVQMGTYFQVQDDFLDCFGAPEVIGKIGTDIEDTKCSWLIVQALKRADDIQKKLLKDNYGKADHSCVEKVKKVYNELQLQKVFEDYESESHSQLVSEIEKQDDQRLQAVLKSFLAKIYKRQK